MKYFSIVLMISVFVVFYVWQNIEMMKMKMDYKKLIRTEQEMTVVNDKLKYDFEKLRNFHKIEADADKKNLKRMTPADLVVIKIDEGSKNGEERRSKMKVSDIIKNSKALIKSMGGFNDAEIISIEYDSRKGSAGSLFAAVEGFESDGHSFIGSAVDNGCRCILISKSRLPAVCRPCGEGSP